MPFGAAVDDALAAASCGAADKPVAAGAAGMVGLSAILWVCKPRETGLGRRPKSLEMATRDVRNGSPARAVLRGVNSYPNPFCFYIPVLISQALLKLHFPSLRMTMSRVCGLFGGCAVFVIRSWLDEALDAFGYRTGNNGDVTTYS